MDRGVDGYGSLSGVHGIKIMEDIELLGSTKDPGPQSLAAWEYQRSRPTILEFHIGKFEGEQT